MGCLLIYKIIFNYSIKRVDVTTAFLEGKVKGLVIVELPEGLEHVEKLKVGR